MSRDAVARQARFAAVEVEMRQMVAEIILFNQAIADRVGLNPTDLQCLGILLDAGAISAGRLATLANLTTGAITGVVDRLVRAGYVRRTADPADRRRVIVEPLTARAEQEIRPLYATMGEAMAVECAHYSNDELALIADFLARTHPLNRAQTARLRSETPGKKPRWDNVPELTGTRTAVE